MSKDPAILFYTSDFLTGTILMTNEQKGKYITLLCIQHQKGLLSEKDMMNICLTYDKDIFDKFIKDGDFYYNERMKIEHEKRKNYTLSRSKNRLNGIENQKNKKKKKTKSSYDEHMENENINEYGNIIKVWLDYKKSRSESYKGDVSIKLFEKKLRDLSNNDLKIAEKIVEQSMANNWAGIFELKLSKSKVIINHNNQPVN